MKKELQTQNWVQHTTGKKCSYEEVLEVLDFGHTVPTVKELTEAHDSGEVTLKDNSWYWVEDEEYCTLRLLDTTTLFQENPIVWVESATVSSTAYLLYLQKSEPQQHSNHKLHELLQVQKNCVSDPYNLGLYNGLELACAVVENRKPQYLEYKSNQQQQLSRYRVDVLTNENKEVTGLKYELHDEGNWVTYADVRNLVEKYERLSYELRKVLKELEA